MVVFTASFLCVLFERRRGVKGYLKGKFALKPELTIFLLLGKAVGFVCVWPLGASCKEHGAHFLGVAREAFGLDLPPLLLRFTSMNNRSLCTVVDMRGTAQRRSCKRNWRTSGTLASLRTLIRGKLRWQSASFITLAALSKCMKLRAKITLVQKWTRWS